MTQHTEMELGGFLDQIEGGRFAEDVTEALKDLVVEMRRGAQMSGGKPKGALGITIGLRINRGAVEVDAAFVVKRPKPVREGTIMYAAGDGTLSPIDTQQTALDLGGTPALSAGEVRTDITPAVAPVRKIG